MLALASAPASADTPSGIDTYVRARAAASAGELGQASAAFAAALAAAPDNELVASQAFGHAVIAGDWPLSLAAARVLERRSSLLPDARFLLLGEAFRAGDWAAADRQIAAIESEQLFGFAVPILRAWRAQGSGQGDPLALLPETAEGVAGAYAAEQRPFLLIALGRPEGAERLREVAARAGPRGIRLRLAGAAALARRGEREAALSLLDGDDGPLRAARASIEAGRPLPGAIDGAPEALAELLVRLAIDLHAQELTPLAATFARIGTRLAPDSSEALLIAAELLAQQGRERAAVGLVEQVGPGDPFADAAADQKVRMLVAAGDREAALAAARQAAEAPGARTGDWVRLGEILVELDRPGEAAAAFERALALRTDEDRHPEWGLWLLRGGALEEAGRWQEGRAALQRAYELAPDQPFVLNYLGYAQLERRENVREAERLIREAHRLAPDNAAITDSLGWALFLKGDVAEAIPLLERAAEGEPADVEINEHLGDAYFTAGRRIEARFAWRAALVYAEGEDADRISQKLETGLTPRLAAR